MLKKFESYLLNSLTLCGIPQLQRVNIDTRKTPVLGPNGILRGKEQSENILVSTGVNLLAVLSHDGVDAVRTYSNDIAETLETLGIEACRNALLRFFLFPFSFPRPLFLFLPPLSPNFLKSLIYLI